MHYLLKRDEVTKLTRDFSDQKAINTILLSFPCMVYSDGFGGPLFVTPGMSALIKPVILLWVL